MNKQTKINPELWAEFITFGSGFNLEAERLYDEEGKPLYYHLSMEGIAYPNGYEIVGYDINELLSKAIEDGKRYMKAVDSDTHEPSCLVLDEIQNIMGCTCNRKELNKI